MALSASIGNERKRVKVYELKENDWYDRGTGFCAVQTINEEGRIYVEAEDEPDTSLLELQIKREDNFQKQQETLIVWTDQDGIDMALSFQEAEGCGMVWNTIGEVQHRLPDGPEDGFFAHMVLPTAELSNLPDIEGMIRSASTTQAGRDALTKLILDENYIGNLIPLVETAEDLEDLPDLHRLSNIMKTLILFNEAAIIEYIVRDEIIIGVVGALEYDQDFPNHKANHRQYLTDESKFKEVVKLDNEEVQQKIHYTYRLQYLKDVVLARILDDPTFSVLNSLIYFNQFEIVNYVTSNLPFLKELFSVIANPENAPERRKDAVLFVQQSCAIAKSIQAQSRASLYNGFIANGLFSTITFALQHHDAAVRVAGTDIIVAIIEHDALIMRNFIYKCVSDNAKPMTDTLIELLLVETDLGVKAQMADAIKILLEPTPDAPQGPSDQTPANGGPVMAAGRPKAAPPEAFLYNFFDQSAKKLFQPLRELESRDPSQEFSIHDVSLYSHLVEILCFFLRQHSARSKHFILAEGLTSRIAQLLSCSEKHLKLDEHYTRQMTNHGLFEPLLNVILETMPRDNLLNSACLELFEFIRRDGIKHLIVHLVQNYRDKLESITYVDIFSGIILGYDQIMNPPPLPNAASGDGDVATEPNSSFMTSDDEQMTVRGKSVGSGVAHSRHVMINGGGPRWQGLKDPDADEDAYFNTSDDDEDEDRVEEDGEDVDELAPDQKLYRHDRGRSGAVNGILPSHSAAASSLMKPLVDYGEDEDEDEDADEANEKHASGSETVGSEAAAAGAATTPGVRTASAKAVAEPPRTSLAEKRRREEDEDDELGKLSASAAKRRNSGEGVTISTSGARKRGVDEGNSTASAAAAESGSHHATRKAAKRDAAAATTWSESHAGELGSTNTTTTTGTGTGTGTAGSSSRLSSLRKRSNATAGSSAVSSTTSSPHLQTGGTAAAAVEVDALVSSPTIAGEKEAQDGGAQDTAEGETADADAKMKTRDRDQDKDRDRDRDRGKRKANAPNHIAGGLGSGGGGGSSGAGTGTGAGAGVGPKKKKMTISLNSSSGVGAAIAAGPGSGSGSGSAGSAGSASPSASPSTTTGSAASTPPASTSASVTSDSAATAPGQAKEDEDEK